MKTLRRTLLFSLFGALLAFPPYAAAQAPPSRPGDVPRGPPPGRPPARPARHSIPEFDPATAGAIAAVVVGGTVLVLRRRKT